MTADTEQREAFKCCGCGKQALNNLKPCDCPTMCGFRGKEVCVFEEPPQEKKAMTSTRKDTSREAFEKWYSATVPLYEGTLVQDISQLSAWAAWQAAKADERERILWMLESEEMAGKIARAIFRAVDCGADIAANEEYRWEWYVRETTAALATIKQQIGGGS